MRSFVLLLVLLLGLTAWAEKLTLQNVPFQVDGKSVGDQPVLMVEDRLYFQKTALEQLMKVVIKAGPRGATVNGKPISGVRVVNNEFYLPSGNVVEAMGWKADVQGNTLVLTTGAAPAAASATPGPAGAPTAGPPVVLNLVRKGRETSPAPNSEAWSVTVVIANRSQQPMKLNLSQLVLTDSNNRAYPSTSVGEFHIDPGKSQTVSNVLFTCPSRTNLKHLVVMAPDGKSTLAHTPF